MKSKNKNFSGRIISPWYDSDGICICMLFLMVFIFGFGVVGIYTALEKSTPDIYIKVPAFLTGFSLFVFISIVLRLVRRRKVNRSLESLSLYR